jgi:hypothetical protein
VAIKKIPLLIESSIPLGKAAYRLLKLQSKFFTKKQKEKAPIIKIISDVFCQQDKYFPDIEKVKEKEAAMRHMCENFTQDVIFTLS